MKSEPYYRSDIDGLRGVAVLFVLAFHGCSRLLPGGFIGVDVFFVISGYLISSIIFKDLYRDRFTVAGFYSRRIKRIFPALVTVLVATCVLGWLVLFPFEFKNLGKHIVGGATFSSNFLLWGETGYFDDAAESKPLLHLWSLGIEEQFYMGFPLALWFAYRNGFAITRLLGIALALSFGLSFYGTLTHPSATFYLPLTRLWELMVGCALASHESTASQVASAKPPDGAEAAPPQRAPSRALRSLASLAGLGMVFGAAFYLNQGHAFPGAWALLPTFGTALVVWAGRNSPVNQWLLGNKLIVGVGLISYPLYLWHWPLLYFARTISPGGLPALEIAAILSGSILLATLTYWLIEKPIRFGELFGNKKVFALSGCMCGLLVAGIIAMAQVVPSRLGLESRSREVGMAVNDWHYPFTDNYRLSQGFKKDLEMGRDKNQPGVLFIGDSHMQQYWPRIEWLLKNSDANARPIAFLTAAGSPTLPGVNRIKPGFACDKFFEFAMTEAAKTNVGTVVFTCFWEGYFIGCFPDGPPEGIYRVGDPQKTPVKLGSQAANEILRDFGQAIAKLTGMGKEVFVMLSGPSSLQWNPKASPRMASHAAATNELPVARKNFEQFVQPINKALAEVVLANGGKIIDPLDSFEESGFFNGKAADGRFRYKDANHYRPFYAMERATFLDALVHTKTNAAVKIVQSN